MVTPTDTLFANQWHLHNTGQFGATPGVDINVLGAWDIATGAGVSVGVYDSGVQFTHQDLNDNYDASLSVIIDGAIHGGYPFTSNPSNTHGTAVAGLIAAEANGEGTVGVAYDATVTGIDIFALSNANFLSAMQQMTNFDVTNHSYGYGTPFLMNKMSAGFFQNFVATLENAVDVGRGGLGSITVHSAGNDRTNQYNSGISRDANDDNFTNSRFVISVAALKIDGFVTSYSTPGAPILVSAAVGGDQGSVGSWTTDFLGAEGYNSGADGTTLDNATPDYNSVMNGTSAASPIVAGVVALMLDANPLLGWRDVQQILAYTARHSGSEIGTPHQGDGVTTWEKTDWSFNGATNWNGGGLHFSNDYGFGLVDAAAAVRLAKSWTAQSVSSNEESISTQFSGSLLVPDNDPTGATHVFNISGNAGFSIETIALQVDWSTLAAASDIRITLTSPDGTTSLIFDKVGQAFGDNQFPLLPSFEFTSQAFRGINSINGDWTVKLVDDYALDQGVVSGITLTFYGATKSVDSQYIYTDEYGVYGGTFGHGTMLADSDGGTDTINAAAVSRAVTIHLNNGVSGTIAGKSFATDGTIENVIGGAGGDTITGNDGSNRIDGSLGADLMSGGLGDDIYIVDNLFDNVIETANEGNDTIYSSVTYNIASRQVETLILTGTGNIAAGGNSLANTLTGNSGNNVLDGRAGADVMAGGLGNDIYYVDNLADNVIEAANEGNDTIYSSVTYNIASRQVETLILTGTGNIAAGGNSLANTLTGNSGNNVLDGRAGADVMAGGLGNDIYYVDNLFDNVIEAANEGNDTIYSSVTYNLASRQVETLILTGTGHIAAGGNSLANTLTGNSGNNVLDGRAGADVMAGGLGNDIYYVDNLADNVIEAANEGNDTIYSSVTYNLASRQVETLILTGTGHIAGFGNALVNTLTGNGGNNMLDGAAGSDTLTGGLGLDTFRFSTALGAGNIDTISDFSVDDDVIALSSTIFAAAGPLGTLEANAFAIGAEAVDALTRIIYDSATGQLFYDADGTGAGAAVQFATLGTGLAMTSADFLLI